MGGKAPAPSWRPFEASSPDTAPADSPDGADDGQAQTPPPQPKRRRVSFAEPSSGRCTGLRESEEEGEIVDQGALVHCYTVAERARTRMRTMVHLAQAGKYQVDRAARLYLRDDRTERLANFLIIVSEDFNLPDRVAWSAARLLQRYIGMLARHHAGESPHGASGCTGEFVGPTGAEIPQHTPTCARESGPLQDSRLVEVGALACLLIATKVGEKMVPAPKHLATCLEEPTREEEVKEAEMNVLSALAWDVAAPTPRQIAEQLLVALGVAPPNPELTTVQQSSEWRTLYFFCDVSMSVRELVFEPATYAAAAALLALWRWLPLLPSEHPLRSCTVETYEAAVVQGCEVALSPARIYAETLSVVRDELAARPLPTDRRLE